MSGVHALGPDDRGSANRRSKVYLPQSVGDAAKALRELAEPVRAGDCVKALVNRAAHAAGLSYTRARDLWYAKARQLQSAESQLIAAALAEKREKEASHAFNSLAIRLARAEALLAQILTDQGSVVTRASRVAPDGLGRGDSALD